MEVSSYVNIVNKFHIFSKNTIHKLFILFPKVLPNYRIRSKNYRSFFASFGRRAKEQKIGVLNEIRLVSIVFLMKPLVDKRSRHKHKLGLKGS